MKEPNVSSLDGEESVGSFHASQYSDRHSFSPDENLFQLPDLENTLPVESSSPGLSLTSTDAVSNDLNQKNFDNHYEEDYCKEVRCIESEDLITNTQAHSNPADTSSNACTSYNTSSLGANTPFSGLTIVDNGDKKNMDLCSSGLKVDKRLDHLREDFELPSTEKISPWLTRYNSFSYRNLKLNRSRSCKASLMKNSSFDWSDVEEIIQNTPLTGDEKDFAGRPEGLQRKVSRLNYSANEEIKSWNSSRNSVERSSVDDTQNVESSTNKETKSSGSSAPKGKEKENRSLSLLDDHEVFFYCTSSFLCFFLSFSWSYSQPWWPTISHWI